MSLVPSVQYFLNEKILCLRNSWPLYPISFSILLYPQLRQNCSFAGYYGFVGGHLDGDEKITTAAVREVVEEIGVQVDEQDLVLKTICHSGDGAEYLQFYFENDTQSSLNLHNW